MGHQSPHNRCALRGHGPYHQGVPLHFAFRALLADFDKSIFSSGTFLAEFDKLVYTSNCQICFLFLEVQITSWSNFCFTDQVWLMRVTSLKKAHFLRYMVQDNIFDQFSQRVETMYQTIFGPVRSSSLYDYQTHFHHLYLLWISIASIST